jgi:hypothetical protein
MSSICSAGAYRSPVRRRRRVSAWHSMRDRAFPAPEAAINKVELSSIEKRYPGFAATLASYESRNLPHCNRCGSAETASVISGVIARPILLIAATTKVRLLRLSRALLLPGVSPVLRLPYVGSRPQNCLIGVTCRSLLWWDYHLDVASVKITSRHRKVRRDGLRVTREDGVQWIEKTDPSRRASCSLKCLLRFLRPPYSWFPHQPPGTICAGGCEEPAVEGRTLAPSDAAHAGWQARSGRVVAAWWERQCNSRTKLSE